MEQITERPICGYKGCESPAFLNAFGRWLCGECFLDIQAKLKLKLDVEIESL